MANKSNIKLWVDALRSGKYLQGRNRLAYSVGTTVKYCCLGVACEVAIENGVDIFKSNKTTGIYYYDHVGEFLPDSVLNWLGIINDRIFVKYHDKLITLDVLNDDKKLNFTEIADVIEQNFL